MQEIAYSGLCAPVFEEEPDKIRFAKSIFRFGEIYPALTISLYYVPRTLRFAAILSAIITAASCALGRLTIY